MHAREVFMVRFLTENLCLIITSLSNLEVLCLSIEDSKLSMTTMTMGILFWGCGGYVPTCESSFELFLSCICLLAWWLAISCIHTTWVIQKWAKNQRGQLGQVTCSTWNGSFQSDLVTFFHELELQLFGFSIEPQSLFWSGGFHLCLPLGKQTRPYPVFCLFLFLGLMRIWNG